MTKIKMYQVDAFAEELFSGNPAAVCILNETLDSSIMQRIANENNLAETVFIMKTGEEYSIRWFSPEVEVDLCGHATLAAAFILFSFYEKDENILVFKSMKSGLLSVEKQGEYLVLDFPTDKVNQIETPEGLEEALGATVIECYQGTTDIMVLLEDEHSVRHLKPNMFKLSEVECRGVIVTAKGENQDFVSRFFAPQIGIPEDPVTGSAHTMLIPYWKDKLNKNELKACQLSKRRGYLDCKYDGKRVKIGGKAVLYLTGEITV